MQNNTETRSKQIYFGSKDELDSSKLKPTIKFSEIATGFDYGVSAEAKEFDGENQYIRITDITDNGNFDKSKLSSPSKGLEDKFLVQTNDILFARTGASVGKSYLYNPADGALYFAGFLIRMNVSNLNSYYVKSYLQTNQYWKQVKLMSARSGQPGINSMEYKNFTLPNVTIEKSEKIGELLSSIDNLIYNFDNILSTLKNAKAAFIKNNIIHMGLGNSDDPTWKKYRLSDILTERNEQCIKGVYEHVSLTKNGVVPKSDRYDRDALVNDDTKKRYKVTKVGDLVYNPANLKFGVIAVNKYKDSIFSPIYVTYEVSPNTNILFLEALISSFDFINYIRKYEEGTVYERMAVKSLDFQLGIIKLPEIKTQLKIANTLSQMDNLTNKSLYKVKILFSFKKIQFHLLYLHIIC